MICKNFIFNGFAIPFSAEEARTAGWYASLEWTNVSSRNTSTPKQDYHGVFYDPTYADQRIININGEIFEQDLCKRDQLFFELKRQFGLATFPATDDEYKVLEFEDNCGVKYFIKCKVYTTVQLRSDYSCGAVMGFSISLAAQDPFIRELIPGSANVTYSLFGGMHLDDATHLTSNLPQAMNHIAPETVIDNVGSFGAPTVFTLKGPITNPIFVNYTNEMWYGLDLTLSAIDTLVINAEDGTVKVNGGDVSSYRMPGSNFVFLNPGENFVGWTNDVYDYDNFSSMQDAVCEYYITHL